MLHDQSFGTWIKRRRKLLDLTQAALADRIGCAEITLRKIEAGTRRPSAVLVRRLIDYLDVPEAERTAIEELARRADARPSARPGNVPWPTTPLLGRVDELAAVSRLLRDPEVRWVTVAGPAGVGKTRFALEIARRFQAEFGAEVHVLSLAHVADPALLLPSLARHFAIGAGPRQPLLAALAHGLDRPLLLVLDNLEQIAAAAADLHTLVTLAPRITLLITSRVLLGVPGERVMLLDPLPVPAFQPAAPLDHWAAVPAVALFLQRAQAVDPTFALTQANVADVLAICRRLDGVPLALELAAARSILFSPRHLLDRLQSRLSFLAAGSAAVERRHSSLAVAIQWSYDLLPPAVQRLFHCLAVFVGGWTLEAAIAVATGPSQAAAEIEAGMAVLLANSMIVRVAATGGERRFTMLEMLREYALERLGQTGAAAAVVERHAAYYAGYAEALQPQANSADEAVWNRLGDEYPNLRAVLAGSIERGRHELAGRLAGSLCWFWWNVTNFDEARRWYGAVLVFQDQLSAPVRAGVLFGAAKLSGDPVWARPLYEECIALRRGLGDPLAIAEGLIGLGQAATIQGEFGRARAAYQEALAFYRGCADTWGIYLAVGNLGAVALMEADLRAAADHIQEIRGLARLLGHPLAHIMAQHQSGLLLIVEGRLDAARRVFAANGEQAAGFSNARRYVALAQHNLAIIAVLGGQLAEAGACLRASLRQLSQMADTVNLLAAFECAAAYLLRCGLRAAAQRTWLSVQALRAEQQLLAGVVERACIYPLMDAAAGDWPEQPIPFKDSAALLRYLAELLEPPAGD